MIDIAELRKKDIGRWVLYTPSHGAMEKGKIKSWSEHFIFVVYHCDGNWDRFADYTAAGTSPKDLRFTTAEEILEESPEESP